MEINMVYYLNIIYDHNYDDFFAFVDDGTKTGETIFQIDDTEEMCEYIKTGVMKHIDDTDGLQAFLLRQELIQPNDIVILNKELAS